MPRLTAAQIDSLASGRTSGKSYRQLGAEFGIAPSTVMRALSTRGRIPDTVRAKGEFTKPSAGTLRAPRRNWGVYAWDLAAIRAARDSQMRGDFAKAVPLARAMHTDDALFTAFHNRLAPQNAVQADLIPASGTRGEAVAKKARGSAIAPREVIAGVLATLADHGIAIGYITREVNDQGTKVDLRLEEWPLEHVRWNPSSERLETKAEGCGEIIPIVHGDGEWVVFRKFEKEPWALEAAVIPGALVWGAHAFGLRDWAQSSLSHGLAKVVGELPAGLELAQEDGTLSPQAQAFLDMLVDLVSGERGAGIRPAGSKTDFMANASTAWQVFSELILNRERAATRIYLGTDASLGSTGDAPGVDIATLFGVSSTKIQGDFQAIENALNTGFYPVWTALNVGDSRYCPSLKYQLPDPDAARKAEEYAAKQTAFFSAVKAYRDLGFEVNQAVIDALALKYGVDSPKLVASPTPSAPSATPAPTLAA